MCYWFSKEFCKFLSHYSMIFKNNVYSVNLNWNKKIHKNIKCKMKMLQQFMSFIYYYHNKTNWIYNIRSLNYFIINQIAIAAIRQLIEINVQYNCHNETNDKYKCMMWLLW